MADNDKDHLAPVDHVAKGRTRIPVQFREKPNVRVIVDSRSKQAQEIEVAFQQLRTLGDIENSEGAQLDMIGRNIGQPRIGGWSDETYRVWLRARERANRSNGTPKDIIEVLRLAVGAAPGIKYIPEYRAGFTVRILGLTEDVDAIRSLLTEVTAAGVSSILVYSEHVADEVFEFESGLGLDEGYFAGALEP